MSLRVRVDVTNPGQFFASCGLFELAARLDPEAVAHFERDAVVVTCKPTLAAVLDAFTCAPLEQLDLEDDAASPMQLRGPFELRLDWWTDVATRGKDLKTWAGRMQVTRIAHAMLGPLRDGALHTEGLFEVGQVVYEPDDPTNKVEPFYFDGRRAPNAHSRDVGFSPNDLGLITIAYPAVEVLCLVGLQRFRPSSKKRLSYEYRTWSTPLPITIASAVVAGAVPARGARPYRFDVWYRTGQKKTKAFRNAVPFNRGE